MAQKKNDLELIRQLERETGILKQRREGDVSFFGESFYTIDKAQNVIALHLHSKDAVAFPSTILEFDKLLDLRLFGFQFHELPDQIVKLNRLETLELNEIPLGAFPKQLLQLKNLKSLSLEYCELTTIPESISELSKLKTARFTYSRISEFPKGLLRSPQLEWLSLSENQIETIPAEIENLGMLKILHLSYNRISCVPDELFKCHSLEKLWLDSNRIAVLPSSVGRLVNLVDLDLHQNELESLPKELFTLKNLTDVRVSKNKISRLDPAILALKIEVSNDDEYNDGTFSVGDNSLVSPPPEVIDRGREAIREYFAQLDASGARLVHEAKLILLGDGRSGKTSLANRLLGKELPTETDRTLGVDVVIGAYQFALSNGDLFKINIWDFAGQDKYKTLHQLFYTEGSVYVMVAESGNTSVDFDDWFQSAELFGEGSPLLLLLNEFKPGIGRGSFDTVHWKKRFPELLKEVFTVNLHTRENLADAEAYIRLLAQTLPHTKQPFPASWVAVREVLNARRNEQYLSLQEYLDICRQNGLPERESALVLSSVLHKVGDCLHYQKSPLLRQFIILKNEWATDAVYKILDDEIVGSVKHGFFDLADLERIWCNPEYEDMRPQLLELMKQFKLAYQLPGKEEYVTPPLLPPARPDNFAWPDGDSLELYIDYEFMPKVILTQFIVTRHADIAQDRTLVWRHGVVLEWAGEALAEISKTRLQGRDAFYIRTQGKSRKELMTVVVKTFRELHKDYKGIKFKELVPCAGCRSGENQQWYFDFRDLGTRLEKRRYEVECPKSLEIVSVLKLLENMFVFETVMEGRPLELKEQIRTKTRLLRIFLASSNELEGERKKIEQELARKNKLLQKRGFCVELLHWEDEKFVGRHLRSQDNYNLEIDQCHLFALLFYSKVGKYTAEEFERAVSLAQQKGGLVLRVFQKDAHLPKTQSQRDATSRFEFIDRLKALEVFPDLFQNEDQLVNQLEDVIDKLLDNEQFTATLPEE